MGQSDRAEAVNREYLADRSTLEWLLDGLF